MAEPKTLRRVSVTGCNSQGKRHLGNWDSPHPHEHLGLMVSVTLPHYRQDIRIKDKLEAGHIAQGWSFC